MNDSLSYIVGAFGREPFYPLLIRLFELCFGDRDIALTVLYIFQGICGLLSCLFLMHILRKRFQMGWILSIVSWGLLLMPFFFDSFFEDGVVYSHYIMTECLSYSMFYLYIALLIVFLEQKKMKYVSFVIMVVLTVIMTMNRNQMMILHGVSLIAAVIVFVGKWKKRSVDSGENIDSCKVGPRKARLIILLFAQVFLVAGFFIGTDLLTKLYCQVNFGLFEKSSENSFTSVTNLLYLSEEEDVALFDDSDTKAVFEEIYEKLDDNQYRNNYSDQKKDLMYVDSGSDYLNQGRYMSVCHDLIKSTILRPVMGEYAQKLGYSDWDYEGDQIKKQILSEILSGLREKHLVEYILVCASTWPYGFAYDVMPIFYPGMDYVMLPVGIMIWIAFIVGFLLLACNKNRRKRNRLLIATVFCIAAFTVCNTVAISFVIFYVTRYLNYTQGLIWIMAILVWRAVCSERFSKGKRMDSVPLN